MPASCKFLGLPARTAGIEWVMCRRTRCRVVGLAASSPLTGLTCKSCVKRCLSARPRPSLTGSPARCSGCNKEALEGLVRRWGAGSLGGQGVAMTAGKGAETGKASPMGYRGVSRAGGWAQGVCVGYGTAGPAHEWSTEEQHPGMFLLLPDRLAAACSRTVFAGLQQGGQAGTKS
jgi:hypothetical protein